VDEPLREATLLADRLFLLEPVDQIDDVEEAGAAMSLDRLNRQRQPEMAFAGAGRTSNILPINILPKSAFNTAFTRAMGNG